MKLTNPLQNIATLQGVEAAFVFDQFMTIVSREVPAIYSNDVLKRIAQQLYALATLSWESGVVTTEYRVAYDKYAVYVRALAQNHFLVIFLSKSMELADFRQPVNLAVLNLERSIRGEEAAGLKTEGMGAIALLAEQSLKLATEMDQTFVGRFRKLCFDFIGLPGKELVDNGVEDNTLNLPLRNERDMRALVEYVLQRIPHPIKRRIVQEDSEDLIRAALKEI
jgi:hypothetical protein